MTTETEKDNILDANNMVGLNEYYQKTNRQTNIFNCHKLVFEG